MIPRTDESFDMNELSTAPQQHLEFTKQYSVLSKYLFTTFGVESAFNQERFLRSTGQQATIPVLHRPGIWMDIRTLFLLPPPMDCLKVK